MRAAYALVAAIIVAAALAAATGLPGSQAARAPIRTFAAPATSSVWWVGASSTDSSAMSNTGVRGEIQVVSTPVTGCLAFWVSDDLVNDYWGQVGYYICNTDVPVAFYQIWNLSANTVLTTGTASVSTGDQMFSMYLQSGTTWAFSLDGTVFGTYDMGASVSSPSYPVYALSEEEADSVFSIPTVTFQTAMQVMNSGAWSSVQTAVSYGTAWGVQGISQNASLGSDQIVVGGSLPAVTQGTVLWSPSSTSTTTSTTATLPPVTTTSTVTSASTQTLTSTETVTQTTTTGSTTTYTSTVTSTTTSTSTLRPSTTTTTQTVTTTSTSTQPVTTTVTQTQTSPPSVSTTTSTTTATETITQTSTVSGTVSTTTGTVTSTTTSAEPTTVTVTETQSAQQTVTSTSVTTSTINETVSSTVTSTEVANSTITTTLTTPVWITVTVQPPGREATNSTTPVLTKGCSAGSPSCPSQNSLPPLLSPLVAGAAALVSGVGIGVAVIAARKILLAHVGR